MIAQNRWWVLLCRDAGEALSPNFYLSHMKIAAPRAKNDHRGQMWSEAEACRKRWECHVFQRMLKGEVAPEKCVTWTLTPLPVRASSCCRSPSLPLWFFIFFSLFTSFALTHTHVHAVTPKLRINARQKERFFITLHSVIQIVELKLFLKRLPIHIDH